MSFLSLSKGDPTARDLLQRAIRARYGIRPVPVETIRLGLVRHDKGPFGLPVKVVIGNTFVTASHWRWDEAHKLFGLTIGRYTISFDGGAYYEQIGGKLSSTTEVSVVEGMNQRLWLEAAILLTPLTEPDVTIRSMDDCTLQVSSGAGSVAIIHLNPDDTVAAVSANCYNPAARGNMELFVRPGGGLQTLDGFTVPRQITCQWAAEPPVTFTIVKAEVNPKIPLTEFSMG